MFICIEGNGGSGKSTLASALVKQLNTRGRQVVQARFPTDRPIGKLLRSYITKQVQIHDQAAMQLFIADMIDAQEDLVKALSADAVVICDRYFYSTMVYQRKHYSLGQLAHSVVTAKLLVPDLVVFLDLPIPVIQSRLAARGSDGDRFDEVPIEQLRTFQKNYRDALQLELVAPRAMIRIEEETSLEALVSRVLEAVPEGINPL